MLRIFAKAIAIIVILNFAFILTGIDPVAAITRFNTWWLVGHGRLRLAYPSDFENGQIPIESLLAAHALAYTPKAADEYRVIVLGSSGIMGWGLEDAETFVGQLNARAVWINNKRLVAYNLAYPYPHAARDAIILDAAMQYKPDLVIWIITAASLNNSTKATDENAVFYVINRDRLERLTSNFGLLAWFDARWPAKPAWQNWIALREQDMLPVWLKTLLYPFFEPDVRKTDRRIGDDPIPAKARIATGHEGFTPMPNDTWQFLLLGQDIVNRAGAKLLLVNEPMVIGSGENSNVNYNLSYERALYDSYRDILRDFTAQHNFLYADLWDLIGSQYFTDTPLHADRQGYSILVDGILSYLEPD
jgi:hypothetical protein